MILLACRLRAERNFTDSTAIKSPCRPLWPLPFITPSRLSYYILWELTKCLPSSSALASSSLPSTLNTGRAAALLLLELNKLVLLRRPVYNIICRTSGLVALSTRYPCPGVRLGWFRPIPNWESAKTTRSLIGNPPRPLDRCARPSARMLNANSERRQQYVNAMDLVIYTIYSTVYSMLLGGCATVILSKISSGWAPLCVLACQVWRRASISASFWSRFLVISLAL